VFLEFVRSEDALFHYTKTRTGLECILPAGQLRLTALRETGDPRDYKERFSGLMSSTGLSDELVNLHDEARPVLDRIIREESRVACFCTNGLPEVQTEGGGYEVDRYAIPGGWNKSRMWSQYGDEHRGLCLVFSRKAFEERLAASTASWSAGRVRYVRKEGFRHQDPFVDGEALLRDGVDPYCLEHVRRYSEVLFLAKDLDYRDEAEYRVVIYDGRASTCLVDISTALRGVIAGDRTPEVYFPLIRSLAGRYGAECKQAHWYLDSLVLRDLRDRE
jgi:hypothetical protein